MSVGGDDVEDELRRLRERIEELEEILRAAFVQEAPDDAGDVDGFGETDLWNEGEVSDQANTTEEYERLRRRAAQSPDFTVPYFGEELRRSKVENYTNLFVSGFESLDSLSNPLSDREFNEVLVEIFIASRIAGRGPFLFDFEIDGEIETVEILQDELALMVEKAGLRPVSFGVSEDVRGEMDFFGDASPMVMLNVYDSHWFSLSPPSTLEDVARPWESLQLETPPNIQEALQSEQPLDVMVNNRILVGGRQDLQEFIVTDVLPKNIRRDRNGIINAPDVAFDLLDVVQRRDE